MDDCGCKEKSITLLGGSGSLLKLIRRSDSEKVPLKSETVSDTPVVTVSEEVSEKSIPLSTEDEIEIKRLNHILEKIEKLRNVNKKSIFSKNDD